MKKRIACVLGVTMLAMSMLSGCGIVTVVKIGEEISGAETFDANADSGDDWSQVVDEITGNAVDIAEAAESGLDNATAVSGKATIVEFNTDTPKYYLLITPDGYTGNAEFRIQAGGVYSGTTIRDAQTVKEFKDYTNQTEWSKYGKALNEEVDTQIVAPLGLDASVAGKTVEFVGAAIESNGTVTITPVSMTIE